MQYPHQDHRPNRFLLWAIALALTAYIVAAAAGLPQQATKFSEQAGGHQGHPEGSGSHFRGENVGLESDVPHAALGATTNLRSVPGLSSSAENTVGQANRGTRHFRSVGAVVAGEHPEHPPYWTVLPFALLLLGIATLPLLPATAPWWESNAHRFTVSAALAGVSLAYCLFWRAFPLHAEWPMPHWTLPAVRGPNFALARDVFLGAVFGEYGPFILLLFSLYTIGGGIRIAGDLPAHPRTNALVLAAGALLASLIGTTGAAMLLLHPLLEINRQRRHVAHTVIFFIFIVCNCGGCLLPTGDPPLFLGYLLGVSFFWTLVLWRAWAFVNLSLIALYYLLDRLWCYRREPAEAVARDETRTHRFRFRGIWPNALLLAATIACVPLLDPGKPLPGTAWHPWLYLREMVLLGLIAMSLLLGSHAPRRANKFGYGAILEVAVLFFGIFITMQPALEILRAKGPQLGLDTPARFFWSTGGLSAVLDNTPTYVVFFETAKSLGGGSAATGGVAEPLLAALSLGAVFMGAMTYIGNGPNFMVRAMAQRAGVRMPGFFGYMVYSCAILLPLLWLTEVLFLK